MTGAAVAQDIGRDSHAVVGHSHDQLGPSVTHNGPGFDSDSAQRAFDAFFSTRPDGMGRGLAICRSTVEAHEGTVRLVSEPGAGARLSICLPLLSDPPGA
jgi:signal transduction histidine kinase